MAERKIYPSLDIMKFIMAMLILTQHTSNEWAHSTGLVHAFFGLGNFAVPFFFACSGFLFFSKLNTLDTRGGQKYYRKWSLRIGKMYLVWSIIYFCFVFARWCSEGLNLNQPITFVHRSIVFSTYATIWFLPALWLGVSICYWLKRHISKSALWIIMLLLFVVGNLFGSYTNILMHIPVIASFQDWYMSVFITWRNGVFNGAPYVFIGILLAEGMSVNFSRTISYFSTLFFCGAFIVEAFCITHFRLSRATDMGFMMAPAIFFLMNSLIKTDIKQKSIWTHYRNLSMLIFLGQRLFLSAIPGVLPTCVKETIISWPQSYIFLLFITLTLGFSISVERLSTKYKFLKNLW